MKNKDLDEIAKQKYKIREIEREIARNKKRKEEQQEKLEVKKVQKEIKKVERSNDEDLYKKEYEKLKKNKYFKFFGKVSEYSNLRKKYKEYNELGGTYYNIAEDIIIHYAGLGIISVNNDNTINLTEKGKKLSQLYFEENNKN